MVPNTPFVKFVLAAATLLCAWALYQLLTPPAQPRSDAGVVTVDEMPRPIKPPVNMATNPPGEALVPSAVPTAPNAQAPGPVIVPGSLSVAGAVLNQQGERLANMVLIAAPSQVFRDDTEKQAHQLRTSSDVAGRYRFDGLTAGDYSIRNEATASYPSTGIKVRAGADQANLVLTLRQDLWVYGVVKEGNQPLAGVQIGAVGEPSTVTYSDSDGSFGIYLAVHGAQESLYFSLDGYHDKRVMLSVSDPYASDFELADMRLERVEGQARVRGSVTAGDVPLANARVFLRSTDRTNAYDTTTDAGGYFVMQGVVIGNYDIIVVPRIDFQDYTQSNIRINESGLELRIALEALDSATLRGRMVDVNGSPVPGFSLWLTSLSARARGGRPIAGDTRGVFEVESLPAGELVFATRSDPRLRITGARVGGPDDPLLELVLDVGDNILSGQVVDAYSNPVPGAQVSLAWSHETGEITSHSRRNTTTDTTGNFRFSRLGPGVHTLTVDAPNYQHRRIEQAVGTAVQIELTALSH